MSRIQVSVAIDSRENAERLARTVVEERLAACAQLLSPIRSTYWWQGKIEEADESLLLIKTTVERYPALEARIKELHPYDVPEIAALPITDGSPEYLAWIDAETRTGTAWTEVGPPIAGASGAEGRQGCDRTEPRC